MKKKPTTKATKTSGTSKPKKPVKSKKAVVAEAAIEKDTTIVFHKTNCTTSRTVMEYLGSKKVKTAVRLYLEDPPTTKELEMLLAKLDLKPHDLIRTKEPYYQQKLKGLKLNDHEWIRIMVENPVLIERPILIKGNRAIIGRPIERVMEFIKK